MSKYGNYLKKRKESGNDFYFGEGNWKKKSNQYIEYKSVIDENTIIIRTNNIKIIKGNYVLLVGNNKGVYLKEWQVRPYYNYFEDASGYLVKLSRVFFKTYTFKSDFEGYFFSKELTFDDLFEGAKEQEGIMAIVQKFPKDLNGDYILP